MRKILFLIAVAFLLLPVYAFGFSEKGQDCSKCHALTNEEASTLLKDFLPNPKILEIRPSPIKDLWEVDVEAGGKKGLVYIDFSKKHLISGAIFSVKDKKNLTQERLVEINKVDVSQIPIEDALLIGNKDARYRIIVFDDPE
ncbi:MAG: disulfide isomerase DsbC N-terminal domain-containing protein [Nitrospirota bacterium]